MLQHALSRATVGYARYAHPSRAFYTARRIIALNPSPHSSHQATPIRKLHPTQSPKPWTTQPSGDDTIYALSTAPGRAGIAIVRISGPSCLEVCPAFPHQCHKPNIPSRYTQHSVPVKGTQNIDMQVSEPSTTPHLRRQTSSTSMRWSSASTLRKR